MKIKLTLTWVAVLALGSAAWVALGLGHSPFDVVGWFCAMVCVLFILDCVETATGRTVNIYRLGLVIIVVDTILSHVHVPETASIPFALILGWKFEDFLLRYRAAKAIRKLTGLGPNEVAKLSTDELSEKLKEKRGVEESLKK
jgi:hypothetical protein